MTWKCIHPQTSGPAQATPMRDAIRASSPRLGTLDVRRIYASLILVVTLGLMPFWDRAALIDNPPPAPSCGQPPTRTPGGLVCGPFFPSIDPIRALWMGRRFDLQTAGAKTLRVVPGIGPRLAERIVTHRAENGPFPSIESVTAIRGLGKKKLEALRDYARLEGQVAPRGAQGGRDRQVSTR